MFLYKHMMMMTLRRK